MDQSVARVLLIEDDALDQSLFRRTLNKARAEVVCVTRLDDALERLAEERFDLVVSDLGLPDSEWEETYARLQAASATTPIVLISGHEDFVRDLDQRTPRPLVFLKSEVHHDIFPLVALGRILGHVLDTDAAAGPA